MSANRYLERGVSSKKEDVHNAIKNIDKGLFKNAKKGIYRVKGDFFTIT